MPITMPSQRQAVGLRRKPNARRRQPPLGLRHTDPRSSRLQPLTESHELYALGASVYLFIAQVVGSYELRTALFDHLWEHWPKSARGPVGSTESDMVAVDLHDDGASLAAIAAHFCITEKSAAAKIRRGEAEINRASRDVQPDRPWEAPTPDKWAVYVITGEAALAALDVDDPAQILPEPDLELLHGRRDIDSQQERGRDLREYREMLQRLAEEYGFLLPSQRAALRAIDEIVV